MCPFRKVFPFVLFMHLLLAVGIFAGHAEHRTQTVFTLLPTLGVGEEQHSGAAAVLQELLVVQSTSVASSLKVPPSYEICRVAMPLPEADVGHGSSACSVPLPLSSSTVGDIPAENISLGGALDISCVGQKITPPIALHKPKPVRPIGETKGQVVLTFTITAEGTVRDVAVESSSSSRMTDAVMSILPKWRFAPARESGRAIELKVRQVVEF